MSVPSPIVQCSNPHCKIAETGKCVEGLEITACGNFGKPLRPLDDESGTEDRQDREMVALSRADRLTPDEARGVLGEARGCVIAIVGPHDCGKTSLIAGLFDQFQDGPVAGVAFRASKTLHAFEQVCHDARVSSQRGTPHSERTRRGQVRFFHLGLQDGEPLNLLLGDRAGEEYREAGDDASLAVEFVEAQRADVVTLLVDGKRLTDDMTRHNAREETLLILQALTDAQIVTRGTRLAIVLTKNDVVRSSPSADRVESDVAKLMTRINQHFDGHFSAVGVFRVAASPTEPGISRGAGIPDLLRFWLERTPPASTERPAEALPARMVARLHEIGGAS